MAGRQAGASSFLDPVIVVETGRRQAGVAGIELVETGGPVGAREFVSPTLARPSLQRHGFSSPNRLALTAAPVVAAPFVPPAFANPIRHRVDAPLSLSLRFTLQPFTPAQLPEPLRRGARQYDAGSNRTIYQVAVVVAPPFVSVDLTQRQVRARGQFEAGQRNVALYAPAVVAGSPFVPASLPQPIRTAPRQHPAGAIAAPLFINLATGVPFPAQDWPNPQRRRHPVQFEGSARGVRPPFVPVPPATGTISFWSYGV